MFSLLKRFRRNAPRLEPNVAGMMIPKERLASLRPDDQFIISYPRSGNTWVRHLLRDVIALGHPEHAYPQELRDLLPAIHPREQPMDAPLGQQFQMPSRIFKSHNISDLMGYRSVYIVRHPADALVSYYHYHRLQESTRASVAEGVDVFCHVMVDGWVTHVQLALEQVRKCPAKILMTSYEGLMTDGVSELRRISHFLGFTPTEATLSTALARNSFERLRSREEAKRGASDEYFFRKGRSGSAQEELKQETLAFLLGKALDTYNAAIAAIESARPH